MTQQEKIEEVLLAFDLALPKSKGGITLEEALTKIDRLITEARIDGLVDASWMVAHMSRKDAHKAIIDRIAELQASLKGEEDV